MESAEQELTTFGHNVQCALASEDNAAEAFRAGRERLLEHVAYTMSRSDQSDLGWVSPRRLAWISSLTVACAAMVLALVWVRRPLSFQVGNRPGRLGDVVEVTGGNPLGVRFSEGSSIDVRDGGRLRVLSTERAGARVLLENGPLDVAIVHQQRRATRWRFEAGPMAVLVTGTKFHVAWNALEQLFTLDMREGTVVVSGGCLEGALTVRAGERLRLSCLPSSETALPPAPAAVPARSGAAPALTAPAAPPTRIAARPAAIQTPPEDWRALLASGHYGDGIRAAERSGLAQVCATANDSDLLALADAARLSGRTSRAIEVLAVLRARFPDSASAATAAFALGRIAFERKADYADAAHWFAAYLEEAPRGPLMGDAVGRLIESRYRAGDRADARREADRYLRRFPRGPYARTAAAILAE